ncbi:hypothetical protein ACQ4M3_08880 [Leptolyngbya sp. AN03gr2]|uniref:hypothetical protein n=1 Tax=unclassified Leptolyngbya TaxID=2650499 RepID=UPI003D324468
MLSTLFACLLIWVLYLWTDRRRLLRLVAPHSGARSQQRAFTPRSASSRKTPTQPRFINSQPNSGATRPTQPPTPQISFEQVRREAARRQRVRQGVSPHTEHDLYRLVRGDKAMVARLTEYERSRNPDRPEQWIWEKVIHDLERDRGYR